MTKPRDMRRGVVLNGHVVMEMGVGVERGWKVKKGFNLKDELTQIVVN